MPFLQAQNSRKDGIRKMKSKKFDLNVSNNSSISVTHSPQKIDASPAVASAFQSQKMTNFNKFAIEL